MVSRTKPWHNVGDLKFEIAETGKAELYPFLLRGGFRFQETHGASHHGL
jgi:hypothetical protein